MNQNKNFKIDFIGIGAAKCATTWIYRCLIEHPQICGPYIKEVNFFLTRKHPLFDEDYLKNREVLYNKGINSYLEYFSHCPSNSVKGEFSVSYLSDPGSAELIKECFPDIKIIACLRDPTKRAHSFYWFAKDFMMKEKNKTFEDALKNNPKIYISWGMYYKQLKPYFNLFPRENVGVFFIDDLKKDPVKFIQGIYEFLGVNKEFIAPSTLKKENSASKVKFKAIRGFIDHIVYFFYVITKKLQLYFLINLLKKIGFQNLIYYIHYKLNVKKVEKPKINLETEKYLRGVFRDDIEKLENFLGRDLSSWK